MAVNGIEIEVGQLWLSHNVQRFTVSQKLHDGSFIASGKGFSKSGELKDELGTVDFLVELLSPAPIEDAGLGDAVTVIDMNEPGYERLAAVLQRAYDQAATGKGRERHACNQPFHEQVMQVGAAKFGVGALLFQAFKKSEESQRLPHDAAIKELLGSIVYLSGAVIALELAKDAAK